MNEAILTQSQITKIVHSSIETKEKLEKELAFPARLQNKFMVEFYRGHIAKLSAMLEDNARATYLAA